MVFCKGLLPICLILINGSWGKPKHSTHHDGLTQGGGDVVLYDDQNKDQSTKTAMPAVESSLEEKVKILSQSCFCPLAIRPVCGTDGVTYPNKHCVTCMAENPKVRIAHVGVCNMDDKLKAKYTISTSPYAAEQKFPFPCYCPLVESLVCDSDGDTHFNVHCMKCVKPRMTISKEGPCDEEDSRYQTYSNK